jgi:hypothetical protein
VFELRSASRVSVVQRWEANAPRYRGGTRGHYESYFLRANHPSDSIGFWLRYTIFVPAARRSESRAEVWAAMFRADGTVAVRADAPLTPTSFVGNGDSLDIRVGHAVLHDDPLARRGSLRGAVDADGHEIRWDLAYDGGGEPVLLLPESWYDAALPRAKALVTVPLTRFDGQLSVDGEPLAIDGWIGSANHNWGPRHTDEYAWGQVAGFDNAPDSFLECSSAHVKVAGPVWAPWLSPLVLRHDGIEYAVNGLTSARRAQASYDTSGSDYTWTLRTSTTEDATQVDITVEFRAPRSAFVNFEYANPPGGVKCCRNSKIAQCRVEIAKAGHQPIVLETAHRAAFEVLS